MLIMSQNGMASVKTRCIYSACCNPRWVLQRLRVCQGSRKGWSIWLHYGCRVEKVRPFSQQEQETFLLETSHAISVSGAAGSGGVSLEIKRPGRDNDRPHF